MAGNKLTAETNRRKYGEDFYSRIGTKGGSTKPTKPRGFAAMSPEKRSEAGRKGGEVSPRRGV